MNKYPSLNPTTKDQIHELLTPIFDAVRKNKIHSYHQLQYRDEQSQLLINNKYYNAYNGNNFQSNSSDYNNSLPHRIDKNLKNNSDTSPVRQSKRKSYYIFDPKPKTAVSVSARTSPMDKYFGNNIKNKFNYTYNTLYSPTLTHTNLRDNRDKNISVNSSRVSKLSQNQRQSHIISRQSHVLKQTISKKQNQDSPNQNQQPIAQLPNSQQKTQFLPMKNNQKLFRVNSKIKKHLVQEIDFDQIEKMFYKKRETMTRYEYFLKARNQSKSLGNKKGRESRFRDQRKYQEIHKKHQGEYYKGTDDQNSKYIENYLLKQRQRNKSKKNSKDKIVIDVCNSRVQNKPIPVQKLQNFQPFNQQTYTYHTKSPPKKKFWIKESMKKSIKLPQNQQQVVAGTSLKTVQLQL